MKTIGVLFAAWCVGAAGMAAFRAIAALSLLLGAGVPLPSARDVWDTVESAGWGGVVVIAFAYWVAP